MAWTTPRTWVAGEMVTDVMMNVHIRDNENETVPAKVQAAGDMIYATGANTVTRLAIGTNGSVLMANNGTPTWAENFVRMLNVGWAIPRMQVNEIPVNGGAALGQYVIYTETWTFDNAYPIDNFPTVIGTLRVTNGQNADLFLWITDIQETKAVFKVKTNSNTGPKVAIQCMAIGSSDTP